MKFLFLTCVLLSIMTTAFTQTDSTLDLYLLIGQSNMSGRGIITDEYKSEGSDSVLMLNKEGQWVKARHPLHFDKPSKAGVGPGLRFGMEMAKITSHKVGLIPCAVGGTSINVWKPGGYDKITNTYPFDNAIKRLQTGLEHGKLKGVIWLQGEADSDSTEAANYLPKLIALIEEIRSLVKNPTLPFVAGEIGRFRLRYQNINAVLACLQKQVSFTAVASSAGLTDKGDQTHFDAGSADEYGRRFAEAMRSLLKKNAFTKGKS